MKHLFLSGIIYLLLSCGNTVQGQKINYAINEKTGSLKRISIENDGRDMNWVLTTDGSQYEWVKESYGWGLGEMTIGSNGQETKKFWHKPERIESKGKKSVSTYNLGEIEVTLTRNVDKNDLVEEITFRNKSAGAVSLKDIAVNTPFNDNYPDSETCRHARTNAHIWNGNHNAYVNAMHMSNNAPHLGFVLTEGNFASYEIRERDKEKGLSNFRGVILMNPEDVTLNAGKSYTLRWRLFSHTGWDDFSNKLVACGSVAGRSDKYVYSMGETARVEFRHNGKIKKPSITINGKELKTVSEGNKVMAEYAVNQPGDLTFRLNYDNGKTTYVQCLGISGEKELIKKRVDFIIDRQQYHNPNDPRNGAYLVYDNDLNRIVLNDTAATRRSDTDEGRERLGMGILLALQYQETGEEKIKESLIKYAKFVRTIQQDDYTTFSSADHKSRHRPYNYPWVAHFYFEMFNVTHDKEFLLHGYHTLKMFFKKFGHGFYAIDLPVKSYRMLKENGFTEEAASLLEDLTKTADTYYNNGWKYPKSEVNYEQTIVAPSIIHQLRMYQLTNDRKYLNGAKEQLPQLESFAGFQPTYFMNEIAIRHWDGYWFGKDRLWGDTYPHYWNMMNAHAYSLYAECTGDKSYQERAENIARNNFCQFFEDGIASCAFIYPAKVDGKKAHKFDPYANDQDWALVYYFAVHRNKLSFDLE
jgi:hypothetical protein